MEPFIVMSIGWAFFSGVMFVYGVRYGVRHYDEILMTIITLKHRDKMDE